MTALVTDGSGLAEHRLSSALVALQAALGRAGWEIVHMDADLTGQAHKAEIKVESLDGKWLLARVDRMGRCSVERFVRARHLGMSQNTRGRRPLSPQIDDHFLGRKCVSSPGELLDYLAVYIADNAVAAVSIGAMQTAWRALLPPSVDSPASFLRRRVLYAEPHGVLTAGGVGQ